MQLQACNYDKNYISALIFPDAELTGFSGNNNFNCSEPLLPSFTSTHLQGFDNIDLPVIGDWAYAGIYLWEYQKELQIYYNDFMSVSNGIMANRVNSLYLEECSFVATYNKGNVSYPIQDHGVYAQGNNAQFLTVNGTYTGNGNSPAFEDCPTGIYTTGVDLRAYNGTMTRMGTGIEVETTNGMGIDIHDITIEAQDIGIRLSMNGRRRLYQGEK